ncbi:glycosyltransferase family 2 protein [Flavobacterium chungbukense]|uniref:Glycosyltransferase n=1 Tax=Flavobacterium chungbukense TaxID=877464 RepID=A0ABP7XLB0_9FLAO|nr:glycosyltransferase family A protein [Flavobacterium chungbukense]MCC4922969.1 glycosyltransferase family 2 protein [Flavobacterium chungbukense]
MNQEIKVSIIVPCYNSEKYLPETIKSILSQSFKFWECVFVNDGSIDGTENVILNAVSLDKRFRYISQNNKGVCIARNTAIGVSRGKYILCLDADDLISENFIEETVKILDKNLEVKVVASTVRFFGRKKGILTPLSYNIPTMLASNQLVVTSLFRKIDFDRVEGFNENMKDGLEDWDFWISILKNGGKVERCEQAVFFYRILKKSRNSEMAKVNMFKLRLQMWENHKELYSKYFVAPTSYSEYQSIEKSKEYRLGKLLLAPVRKILGK